MFAKHLQYRFRNKATLYFFREYWLNFKQEKVFYATFTVKMTKDFMFIVKSKVIKNILKFEV